MRLNAGLAAVMLCLVPFVTGAQEGASGTADTDGAALIARSLERDIATATLDELRAWCDVAGLDAVGTLEVLRRRLSDHYGISGSATPLAAAGGGIRIVIESAERSEYLNLDGGAGEDESVVRLSGNVVVHVDEPERGRRHRVEAATVIFNQGRNTISAVGDIRYTVDTGGNEEAFTGDSLTFEVTDWTGVIFRGTSERQQEVDGTDVEFFFRGDSITRSGPDILVLENGTITSDESENPDYALKARKIWITGPGEWGLLSATLYVGHVPVFYFPFYWKSGSDLLFNPVLGTRTRSGYYIQTTTYLLGRKEADDGFSIMGFGDSSGENYAVERDGLYLVRRPAPDGGDASRNTLKYMLDVYTSLGAMTGFLGSFPEVGEVGSIDFYATVGVTRSVDDTGSPYFNDGSSTRTYWNSSYLGAASVPFRWGTRIDMDFDRWSFYADWYSDPYYMQDFSDRGENFDWLSFLLSETESDTTENRLVTEMLWEIRGSHTFPVSDASPWLRSLSLDSFRTALIWRNKANQDPAVTGGADASYNPARNFYYPDQLILPDMRVSLSGAVPSWEVNRLQEEQPPVDADDGIPGDEAAESGPEPAAYLDSFSAVYSARLLEATLDYGLQSQLYIEDSARSDSWLQPSDIDFLFEPARVNTTHAGNIRYGMDFWDGLTGVSGSTSLSGFYQVHADLFGSGITVSDTTKLEDYQYSQFLWDNSVTAYLSPLQGIPSMSRSRLSYKFDGNIYAYRFDGTVASPSYGGDWISGREDIRTHEAAADINWQRRGFSLSAGARSNIPPLDQRHILSSAASYAESGWRASLSEQINFENDTWSFQPLVMSGGWTGWKDEVTVSQSARYDVENARWSSAESTFGFWGFRTRFIASYGTDYNWDGGSYVWNTAGESFSASSLHFSYNREFKPRPFWKNRITTTTILDTSWNINLRQPTDNVLTFKWTQTFAIYKFLDLSLSFSSTNKAMYLYFEGWRDQLNVPGDYNFFTDLARSFNFFNAGDRRDSQFNMDRMDLSLIHHLRNWDLTVEYSGWPALNTAGTAYRWKSEFSLFVKWNPLPMFNQRTTFEDDRWSVDSFE